MPYKIGFLSKLFHLAPQTIHYYESMGLLKPKRDKGNDYRKYDDESIQRMGTIVKLRNAQFALKETTAAYDSESSCSHVLSSYQEQRKIMQRKVEEDLAVTRRLDEYIDVLSTFLIEGEANWKVEERDAYYHQAFKNNYPSEEEAVDASQWYENLFWTETGMLRIGDAYTFSIDAPREQYDKRIKDPDARALCTQAGQYAVCMLECIEHVDYERLRDLEASFLKDHPKYVLRSAPFARTIVVFQQDKKMHMILELLLPVHQL